MNIRIKYEEQPGLTAETVAMLASFCGYDAARGQMHREEEGWVYEAQLPPGEYYYKFLINHSVLLNDPAANCYAPRKAEEEELWSYIKISHSGERLYNNTQYTVNVEEYTLSATVTEGDVTEKHQFSSILDKRVVARFGFTQIKGVHTVTVLWCDYTGHARAYTEQALFQEDSGKKVDLWFWLDIGELEQPEGVWTMKLYIDGKYVLEDGFQIGKTFLYTQTGKVKNY